jgi:energy-coupling factor transporter ATP-binding protein EcfA2
MDLSGVIPGVERESRAMQLLEMVGLGDLAHKRPAAVSGGQQQSAAIARALANDPPIIVADEPTGNLDSRTAERVFDVFNELAHQGKTIIMVTHDDTLARRTNRTLLLVDGEVINDAVAATLPWLTHQQMLSTTRAAHKIRLKAGEAVLRQGQVNDRFYLITKGLVEVVLEEPVGRTAVLAELGPGQHFGEIELLRNVDVLATIRASASGPVELLTLDREIFTQLTDQVQAMRDHMMSVAQQRLTQNAEVTSRLQREHLRRGLRRAQAAVA